MAESLVMKALLEITKPGKLLTLFTENFDRVYGNQRSHDINEVYSTAIETIKEIKNSLPAGKVSDLAIAKSGAFLVADITKLYYVNHNISMSVKFLDKNTCYEYIDPSAKPEGPGYSDGGSGVGW